ncbi:MAG TPA: hypothetical protein VLT45_05930 [Kofleriaceae bacterium]|nr:hypothetical protein [Kofleriaceae bacterium]
MTERLFALTYWRPWPTLILRTDAGRKDCENRGQPPPRHLIGKRVAVHAGKKYGLGAWPFDGAPPADADCPLGIVGTVRIVGVLDARKPTSSVVMLERYLGSLPWNDPTYLRVKTLDRSPWWAGPVGILVEEPITLPRPIAINGAQGWWPVPVGVAAQVAEQEAEVRRAA